MNKHFAILFVIIRGVHVVRYLQRVATLIPCLNMYCSDTLNLNIGKAFTYCLSGCALPC